MRRIRHPHTILKFMRSLHLTNICTVRHHDSKPYWNYVSYSGFDQRRRKVEVLADSFRGRSDVTFAVHHTYFWRSPADTAEGLATLERLVLADTLSIAIWEAKLWMES